MQNEDMNDTTRNFRMRGIEITLYEEGDGFVVAGIGMVSVGHSVELGHEKDSVTRHFSEWMDARATFLFWVQALVGS